MKAMLNSLVMLIAIASIPAFADFGTETKPRMASDVFNKMIESNNSARTELKKDIDDKTAALEEAEDVERAKVIDFVDVEVGVGFEDNHPVVSSPNGRKYQSVGEARVYKMNDEALQAHESGT